MDSNLEFSFITDFTSNFQIVSSTDELEKNLETFFLELNCFINKTILEGTYITTPNIFKTLNAKFLELSAISEEYTHIKSVDPKTIKNYLDTYMYQINMSLLFVGKINRLYSQGIPTFTNLEIFLDKKNTIFTKYEDLIQLLEYNIELSKIDHLFINEESLIKELFKYKNDIKNIRITVSLVKDTELRNSFNDITHALLLKVEFLIDKWRARHSFKLKDENFKYIDLFTDKRYSDITRIQEYKSKILYLYNVNGHDSSSILRKEYQKILSKCKVNELITNINTLNKLNLFDLHTLIKYYKDEVKDSQKLKKLIQVFRNKENNNRSENIHNIFCIHISKQYCLNNYFSLYCDEFLKSTDGIDKLEYRINKFTEEYLQIKKESTHLTDNFFLDFKFLKTSLLFLEKQFLKNKDNTHDIIKRTSDFFNVTLQKTINVFDSKIQWSLKNNNYIFKLPFEESLVKYKDINIYFSSSFLLPKINDEILDARNFLSSDYQKLNLKYSTEHEIQDIYNLKEDYKKENKKTIEIVTLFTAIVSFIVGSIGGFKFITDIYSAISFVAIFGLCLLSFVLTIMKLIRKDGIVNYLDFIFLFSMLIFIAFISLNMQKTLKPDVNTTNTESTNTIKLKIDN